MASESPAASDRSAALRHGLLFIVVTSPTWLVTKRFPVLQAVPLLGIMLGVTLLFLWWDNRSPSALGLELSWRPVANLLGGLVSGALLIAVIALLLHSILPFDWAFNKRFVWTFAATGLLIALVTGFVAELQFRAYGLDRLIASIGMWPAQIIAALLFASYHLLHGATWQVAFTSSVIGSVMFGLVFVRTRSVLASTGFHAAVNWSRDVVMADPPTLRTWLGPVAGRDWTAHERQTTLIMFNAVALVACVLLYWSIRRRALAK